MGAQPARLLTAALLLAACGGETDGSGTAGDAGAMSTGVPGVPDVPGDASPEAIGAFLDARGFTADTWRTDVENPRPESSLVSPHNDVIVYQNATLIGSRGDAGFAAGSMAVKEMYDGDTPVGYAAMYLADVEEGFSYYCWGPEGRCGTPEIDVTADAPVYGRGLDVSCGHCHGEMVFTIISP